MGMMKMMSVMMVGNLSTERARKNLRNNLVVIAILGDKRE